MYDVFRKTSSGRRRRKTYGGVRPPKDGRPPEMEDLRSFVIDLLWPRPLLEVYIRMTVAAGKRDVCLSVCSLDYRYTAIGSNRACDI